MKTKRKIRKSRVTRRKNRGGADGHKHIKDLLHKLRKDLFQSKYDYYKEIISNHNESTQKYNERDLKKYEPFIPQGTSPEETKNIIKKFKKCREFIHQNKDKVSREFFKIYSNQGIAHRDLFIKKHITKDFVKDLKELYLKPENRTIISNPNQGYFSSNKDYSDDKEYLDHIKKNYVNAFEIPTEIKNEMIYENKPPKLPSDLYIIPRVTLVNIGTIHHYKNDIITIQRNNINTFVSKDEFENLYIPKSYREKRDKYIQESNNCENKPENNIKDFVVHVKSRKGKDDLNKMLDKGLINSDQIRLSENLEEEEMDGGK
jgi:hypothetical protein